MEASSLIFRYHFFSTVVVTGATTLAVHFGFFGVGVALIRGQFSHFTALMIWFIWLIKRGLSPYVASTSGLMSFLLFPALASTAMKILTSIIALMGEGGGDC